MHTVIELEKKGALSSRDQHSCCVRSLLHWLKGKTGTCVHTLLLSWKNKNSENLIEWPQFPKDNW